MHQFIKEFLLTTTALLVLFGGTIFSLVFFKPTGILWQNINSIMAFLGILLSVAIYLVLLDKRDKSINNSVKINFH